MPEIEFIFPLRGLDKNWGTSKQPPLTSPNLSNVRPYDVQGKRARGGQRPGLKKILSWSDGYPAGNRPVIAMEQVTVSSFDV